MSFADGRVHGTCAAASVDPLTLHVISVARGNCGDPALFGEHVMAIVYASSLRNHPGWGTNALVMRIATVDRAARAGYRLGPIIVTYPDGSDSRAETIQGDGSLWVYASTTGPRSKLGELLRISETTGRVVERWMMPPIARALLATDANGLSGLLPRTTPASRRMPRPHRRSPSSRCTAWHPACARPNASLTSDRTRGAVDRGQRPQRLA